MKTTTEMQLVPITKLVPYVNNARTHSPEQINKLRSSLREFGFINPVIIDRDYGVIAGHGRILAAKEEGISEVPCVFADHLTEAQKKAYIIADNRMAMDAGWDEELLRVEIESLQAADFDPLLTGFDEKELSKLFDDGVEAEEDDFDVDAELKPRAKMAYDGEGEYLPGEWCTFCRAAVRCRARAEEKLKLAQTEFRMPPLLTDAEIEDILAVLPDLTKWANEITAYALDTALNHGKKWNGFKVVQGRSVRKYRDEAAVAEAAKEAGYKDIYRQSLIPLTEMQRLMGKDRFEEILGGLITKAPGRPTLVPKSDRRPAMNVSNAINEFYEIKEDI